VLTPIFDPGFSDSSYGFRPGRNAHDAVRAAHEHQQGGKQWVVDLDLKQFFDEVNHDILMSRVGRKVKDKRLKRLINAYLKSGVMCSDGTQATEKGTPQGGPLSPLLSNILLDDLDKELECRGHSFCRYADDCNIYVKSRIAGERVMQGVTEYLEETLKLKVNKEKSAVARPWKRKFLGFSFIKVYGVIRETLPSVTMKKFHSKVKCLFRKGKGRNVARFIKENLNPVLRGWLQYFHPGVSWKLITSLDFWIRRRLRCMIWRQWKRPYTRMKRLISLGIQQNRAEYALNRKGPWWNSNLPVLTQAVSPAFFQKLELYNLADNFRGMRIKSKQEPPRYGTVCPVV
jgi:RNA-directed DNA polymerase